MDCSGVLTIIGGMNTLSLAQTGPSHTSGAGRTVGDLLREWRQRRRMSQLLLATEAEISTRHLSFVESGRAVPSREMVMHLAERLDVPLRARNALLVAAGYAPLFRERPLSDPQLAAARDAVQDRAHRLQISDVVRFFTRRLQDCGLAAQFWMSQKRAETGKADVSLTDVPVPVAMSAERNLRVVKME